MSKAFCKSSNALKNLLSLKLRGIRVAEADVHIVPTDPSNSEVRRILRKKIQKYLTDKWKFKDNEVN